MTAPWRSGLDAALAAHHDDPISRYLWLATTAAGAPAVRMLVFRGFLPGTDDLTFAVDARSRKVEQVGRCDLAEVGWYFSKTREQFRIAGHARILDPADPACGDLWARLSESVRSQYSWPTPLEDWSGEAMSGSGGAAPSEAIPAPFAVLAFAPRSVDYLDLRRDPPLRRIDSRIGSAWGSRRVNP